MSYQEQGGGGRESVVVNGTVEGVEVKQNGRFVVKVREIGSTSQYATSLWTKEQPLAQQMMNAVGQGFSFICGLSPWTNNEGRQIVSKWINGVAPLAQQAQPQYAPPQPQPSAAYNAPQTPSLTHAVGQQAPREATNDAFIRRVSWLAAVPAAVAALDHLPEEQRTVPALVKMTDFLAQTAIARGEHGFDTNGGNPGPQRSYSPTDSAQGNPSNAQVDALMGEQNMNPTDDYGEVPF